MNDEINVKSISVTEPVGRAIERTKAILFSPFDLGKWFTIGFCAWLALLGEGGFNFNGGGSSGDSGCGFDFGQIEQFIRTNLHWIIPLGLFILVVFIAVMLVLAWLQCRGKFMFLYCVAQNKAEVALPWKEYAAEGNSLFVFNLVLGLISLACFIPLIAGWIAVFMPIMQSERLFVASIGLIVALSLLTITLGILITLIVKFTEHFVVPVMYLNRIKCLEAWKRFWGLLRENIGRFIVFVLFLLVLNLAAGTVVALAVLGTCCCACCFLIIPFIGTVIMLPILVFMRSYSAYYLAQYGPQWDVFAPPPGATVTVEATPITNPDDFFRGQS